MMRLHCSINGNQFDQEIEPRLLLIELIRDVAGLKGTHIGCLTGDCGACCLSVDGKVIKSCLMLAMSVVGRKVVTIEGMDLQSLQKAFIAENGFQCGFCTTGMILTAAELLNENPCPTDPEIRHALIGNLCRCTGYDAIVASIRSASETREY